ncbi:MAG: hypothetical protein D6729_07260, partial [Deltaproteobacteria bacterium]
MRQKPLSKMPLCLLFVGLTLPACAGQGWVAKERRNPVPLVELEGEGEAFFVLSSDLPWEVQPVDPDAAWLHVEAEAQQGEAAEAMVVHLKARPGALPEGTYFSGVRVVVRDPASGRSDFIVVPVRLNVGETGAPALARDRLEDALPPGLDRTQPEDPHFFVAISKTLGGNHLIHLTLREREEASSAALVRYLGSGSTASAGAGGPYPLVFPFFALEFLGSTLAKDTGDVELDAVNAVAYERYRISQSGAFTTLYSGGRPLSDPMPWASQNGLPAYPMIVGYSNANAVYQMWRNRSAIAAAAVAEANAKGYAGYVLDVEGTASATTRRRYIEFVDTLAGALDAAGKKLIVAQARWATLAPAADLAATRAHYIGSMDPMHPGGLSMWQRKLLPTYNDVPPGRLVWIFSWDFMRGASGAQEQQAQWAWMQSEGLNAGVAGAAVFRTPAKPPNRFGHQIDYYQGFRDHYPAAQAGTPPPPPQPPPPPPP